MNIVLCGMMGVGKSTVGIKVAELTKRRWFDTDTVITDRHGKISDIFEYYGEAHFRELETQVVRELTKETGLVISTGGGLVLKSENAELLKKNGKIFFLQASVQTLMSRVYVDETRPLLKGNETEKRITELLNVRTPVYERVADFIIQTDGKSPEAVAREIIAKMEEV